MCWEEMSGMFDNAVRCAAMMRMTEKVALTAGSSQHGKARLASNDSNCVLAITYTAQNGHACGAKTRNKQIG